MTASGLLHLLPSGEVSADGRTFTDRDTGFSLRLPAGRAGWKLTAEPGKKLAVQVQNEDGSARVNVGVLAMGSPARLEEVAEQTRASLAAKLGERGRDLGSELVTRGATRYFEMRTEIEAEPGQRDHKLTRLFVHGTNTILLIAQAPAARWEGEEPVLREILDGFALLPLPAPLGTDGHTYTDAARGFSLRVPGEGWTVRREVGQVQLLTLTGPEGVPRIQVLGHRNEIVGDLGLMGMGFAAGLKQRGGAASPEFTVQRSEIVERDGRRWYEVQFTQQTKGAPLHGIARIFLRGKDLFTLTAFVPAARWAEQEKGVLALLDSFNLTPTP